MSRFYTLRLSKIVSLGLGSLLIASVATAAGTPYAPPVDFLAGNNGAYLDEAAIGSQPTNVVSNPDLAAAAIATAVRGGGCDAGGAQGGLSVDLTDPTKYKSSGTTSQTTGSFIGYTYTFDPASLAPFSSPGQTELVLTGSAPTLASPNIWVFDVQVTDVFSTAGGAGAGPVDRIRYNVPNPNDYIIVNFIGDQTDAWLHGPANCQNCMVVDRTQSGLTADAAIDVPNWTNTGGHLGDFNRHNLSHVIWNFPDLTKSLVFDTPESMLGIGTILAPCAGVGMKATGKAFEGAIVAARNGPIPNSSTPVPVPFSSSGGPTAVLIDGVRFALPTNGFTVLALTLVIMFASTAILWFSRRPTSR